MLALAGPAAAALFGDDVARKQDAAEAKRIDLLRAQQEEIAERIARIEEALKNQPVMSLASQIEALREDMRQLRGQIEVVGHNIEMAAKRQRDMYVDLDTRLKAAEAALVRAVSLCGDDASACDNDRPVMQRSVRIKNLQQQLRCDVSAHLHAGLDVLIEVIHPLDDDQRAMLAGGKTRRRLHDRMESLLYVLIRRLVGRL